MTIELKPEQEQRIAEAIRSGAYQSSWELTAGSSSKEKRRSQEVAAATPWLPAGYLPGQPSTMFSRIQKRRYRLRAGRREACPLPYRAHGGAG